MVNKSKAIGTQGETWVKRYAQAHGFPDADRRTLTGNKDQGDLLLQRHPTLGLLIAEVKAGNNAATASDLDVETWMRQADAERANAGAALCPLIWKRAGKGEAQVSSWWFAVRMTSVNKSAAHSTASQAVMPRAQFEASVVARDIIWRTTLDKGLLWLRSLGWGTYPARATAGRDFDLAVLDELDSCACGQVGSDDECVTGCRWDRP